MNYLLLISCSQRKLDTEAPLSAIERYDGPDLPMPPKISGGNHEGFGTNLHILDSFPRNTA